MKSEPPPVSPWNIANVVTVARIFLVPVFAVVVAVSAMDHSGWRMLACLLFVFISATDFVDGWLARSRGLVTEFGKLADPIADKALTGMAFVGLAIIFDHWLFWTVTIIVLVREWGITLMRFVVKKYGVMPAGQNGKIKTTLQAVAIGGYLLPFEIWDNTIADVLRWITHGFMAAAFFITVSTAVAYVRDARKLRRDSKAAASA